ncbi:hypothetical protein, partial [Escherichia coli]|uniref:hypothetical protein n=1 Tax=Escherichia coli TaxID=562 RepID=UPI0038558BAA
MPAELPFAAQLFRSTLSVLTDCLTQGFIRCDTLPKRPAADNLLFRRGSFFKRNTEPPRKS